jgi:hypothetical protein
MKRSPGNPEASVGIHVVTGLPSQSIRSVAELKDVVRTVVQPLLAKYRAVALPRGVIDRRVFPMHGLEPVRNNVTQAQFHRHNAIHLVPDGSRRTGTLVTTQKAAAHAVHTVLQQSENRRKLSEGIAPPPPGPLDWTTERICEAAQLAIAPAMPASAAKPKWMWDIDTQDDAAGAALDGLRALVADNGVRDEASLFEVLRETQLALPADAQALLDWNVFDVGSIAGQEIHARELLGVNRRGDDEVLYGMESI